MSWVKYGTHLEFIMISKNVGMCISPWALPPPSLQRLHVEGRSGVRGTLGTGADRGSELCGLIYQSGSTRETEPVKDTS